MQTLTCRTEQSNLPLGHRRGISNLANFALDLTWARAETDCALSSTRAYPSPPMSGSPPPPPKPYPEVGDRGQGGFQPASHDAYRPSSTVPGGEYRAAPPQPTLLPPTTRPFAPEGPERMPYSYHRPDEAMGRPMSYAPQPGPMVPQPQYPLPPVVGPSLGPSPYPVPSNPQSAENPPYTSPKSQRKTKGHVASACVPCKRAHLRYYPILTPRPNLLPGANIAQVRWYVFSPDFLSIFLLRIMCSKLVVMARNSTIEHLGYGICQLRAIFRKMNYE